MNVLVVLLLTFAFVSVAIVAIIAAVSRKLDKQQAAYEAATAANVQTLEEAIKASNYPHIIPVASAEDAIIQFQQTVGTRLTKFYWGRACPADPFFRKLQTDFDKIAVVRSKKYDSDFMGEPTVFELTRMGSTAILQCAVSWQNVDEMTNVDFDQCDVKYQTVGLKRVTPKPVGEKANKVIQVVRDFTLFFVPQENVKPDLIQAIVDEYSIEWVKRSYEEPVFYEISRALDGSYMSNVNRRMPKDLLKAETLDLHYMPFPVRAKKDGKFQDVLVKPSAYVPAVINLLANGSSICMGHLPGTGKTILARHMIHQLGKNKGARVFKMDANTVGLFSDPGFAGYANSIFSPEYVNVIYLDQAESVLRSKVSDRDHTDPDDTPLSALASKLLNLIDGMDAEQYNLSFLMCYNGDKKHWHPAFTRSGRLLNIDVPKLGATHAQALLKHAIETCDMRQLEVDTERFNNFCEQMDGVSVADVYDCLVSKSVADLLQQELLPAEETPLPSKVFENNALQKAVEAPAAKPPTSKKKRRSRGGRR